MLLLLSMSLIMADAATPSKPPTRPELTAITETARTAWSLPGVAVVVVRDGKLVHRSAHGVRMFGKPELMTTSDVVPIASCTKAFTATLIHTLGIIDDPVQKHLPDVHHSDPRTDALLTIRDLLTHRTGINGHDLLWYHNPQSNADVIRSWTKLPASAPFRSSYQYSTIQYMIAGAAAAKVAGTTWEAALSDRVLKPLNITTATFTTTAPAFVAASKPSGHQRDRNGAIMPMPRYEIREPNPAGSLNIAIHDITPWLLFQTDSLKIPDANAKSLRAAMLESQRPQVVIPFDVNARKYHPDTVQLAYGLGWIIGDHRGHRLVQHGGMIDGFRLAIGIVPEERLGIAVIANLHGTRGPQALVNAIVDATLGLPAKDWNQILMAAVAADDAAIEANWQRLQAERPKLAPQRHSLEKYVGRYRHPAYGIASLILKDGQLTWQWSSFTMPLDYWGDDFFVVREGFLARRLIGFGSVDGIVNALQFEGMRFERVQE
jgi:CubicO group peptidase (beta-lactamase class C family)